MAAYQLTGLVPGGWTQIASLATAAGKFQVFSFKWGGISRSPSGPDCWVERF